MSLTRFLKREKITAAEFSRRTGIPKSSVSNHLAYEAGAGDRPLGLQLSMKAVEAYENLKLADLRPDWAERITKFFEAESHG